MSTTTSNYGLVKPDLTDVADITAMNGNWDKIDSALKEHESHSHSASDVGAVPTSRKVNGKALSSDITLSADDVGARPNTWKPSAEEVGALPLDGSIPMTSGKLWLNNKYGNIGTGEDGITICTSVDPANWTNNMRMIMMFNSKVDTDISEALQFHDWTQQDILGSTVPKINKYNIYGEHNMNLLASNLETLMANGGMSTLQSAIQVTSANIDANGETFSGVGKGKLFISGNIAGNLDYSPDITIDGKSIGKVYMTSPDAVIEIEFLQSFVVTGKKDVNVYCNAVFY